MKAAVYHGLRDIRVEERELKALRPDELTIRVAWAGICGSDLHEYEAGPVFVPMDQPDAITGEVAPLTMGHEFAGIVEAVGSAVTKYQIGDRVVVNPTLTHRQNQPDLDVYDGFSFIGLHSDGGFTSYVNAPETNVYILPANLTLQEGALVEPTAVGVQAVKESGMKFGDTVAIFGAGPIGLVTLLAAKAAGASKIFMFDFSAVRLAKAAELGASVYNLQNHDPIKVVHDELGRGVDATFEVAGVGPALNSAIDVTRARGTVVVVSIFAKGFDFNPMKLTNSGVKLTSTIAYSDASFQQTIDLIANGSLKPQDIVTKKIELDQIVDEGFVTLTEDKAQVKILVELSGEM